MGVRVLHSDFLRSRVGLEDEITACQDTNTTYMIKNINIVYSLYINITNLQGGIGYTAEQVTEIITPMQSAFQPAMN